MSKFHIGQTDRPLKNRYNEYLPRQTLNLTPTY